MHAQLTKITLWYQSHERLAVASFFAAGFFVDLLTFSRIDVFYNYVILSAYLLAAILGIIVTFMHGAGRAHRLLAERIEWILFLMPFAFGGLFSSYVIF